MLRNNKNGDTNNGKTCNNKAHATATTNDGCTQKSDNWTTDAHTTKYTRRHTMSTNDDINDNDTFTRGPEASKSHAKHKARWRVLLLHRWRHLLLLLETLLDLLLDL